jgi:hypothetical protein
MLRLRRAAWVCALASSAAYTSRQRGAADRGDRATALVAPDVYDDINEIFEENPDGWAVKDSPDVSPTRRRGDKPSEEQQKARPNATAAVPQCHRCGEGTNGVANCCSKGGAWEGSCTVSLNEGGAHTWVDGWEACNRSPEQQAAEAERAAEIASTWAGKGGVMGDMGLTGAGGLEDNGGAAIPLTAREGRKCDSEREEWCDGDTENGPMSALPDGGDPNLCSAMTDARGNSKVDDSWCIENCGFNPPNCPLTLCQCDEPGPAAEEARGDGDKSASPLARAFDRRRNAGADANEAFQRGKEEFDRIRRADVGRGPREPEPEAPLRKCQSEWDGNCDRSAFTGKAGAARKKALAKAKGELSGSPAEVGAEEDEDEYELEEEDKSQLGDESGLEDGANPKDCVTVGGAVSDAWCRTACAGSPPNCPASLCSCEKIVRHKRSESGSGDEEEGELSDVPGVAGWKIDALCGPKIGIPCSQKSVNWGYGADDLGSVPTGLSDV